MLQAIRNKSTGPFAYAIIAIIAIPFAFFGIETLRAGGGDPAVAKVDGDKITQNQLQRAYEERYRQYQNLFGENFDPAILQGAQFKRQVLEGLINESVLAEHIDDAGYRVSNAQLADSIRTIPAFQTDGAFSEEAYRATLRRSGSSVSGFQERQRASLAAQQFGGAITGSAIISPEEVRAVYADRYQTRDFVTLTFAATDFADGIEITEQQMRERYEAQQERFRTPERLKLQYIEVNADSVAVDETPDEAELQALYDEQLDRFSTPEERNTRHILVNITEERDSAAAKAEIDAIRARIVDEGESFAEVAQAESDDAGSARDGGSLGWVRRGMMVAPFEAMNFELEAGVVSEPVESDFGWHILLVEEIREESTLPITDESVVAQLTEQYQRQIAEDRFAELADDLADEAFQALDTLEPVAEVLELELQETPWFTREGGGGITANGDVLQAAFSEQVLDAGENSELITLSPDRVVVVRKSDYEAPEIRPFEDVQAQIRRELITAESQRLASEAGKAALAAIKAGEKTPAQIAAETPATVARSGSIQRTETEGRAGATIKPETVRAVFAAPVPGAGEAVVDTITAANGDYVVYLLTDVTPGTVEDGDTALATLRGQVRGQLATAELTAARDKMRSDTRVKIYEDRLDGDES